MDAFYLADYINIDGLLNFTKHFGTAVFGLFVFKYIILFITPYDEWKLIKEEQNTAAAIALGGSILGFSTAISGVVVNAVDYYDFVVWGVVAILTQIASVLIIRFVFMPKFIERIEKNEIPAAVIAASFYVSFGLMVSACMTY